MKNNITNDRLSNLWFVLAQMMPPIGFFLYFKHRHQLPQKARRALTGALLGIPGGLLMGYIMNTYILH